MKKYHYQNERRHWVSRSVMGCLHDPANVQCIQNTYANDGHLLDRVNTLLVVAEMSTAINL